MRAFIAINLSDEIRRAIARLQEALRGKTPSAGLRWVEPERIHLTVKFLGEIDEARIGDVSEALGRLTGPLRPFDVRVEGIGAFGERGPVRVVWVGVEDSGGGLGRCHACCEDAMAGLGFPREERPFSAHLTLARNKKPTNTQAIRAALAGYDRFEAGRLRADHLTFYESNLTPEGPVYRVLSVHALGG